MQLPVDSELAVKVVTEGLGDFLIDEFSDVSDA